MIYGFITLAFVLWLIGMIISYLMYGLEGRVGYKETGMKVFEVWYPAYTTSQKLAYSLTWFVWLTRDIWRLLIGLVVWLWDLIWDMGSHIWEKWRNG